MKNLFTQFLAPFIAIAQISGIASAGSDSAVLALPESPACPEFLNHSFKRAT